MLNNLHQNSADVYVLSYVIISPLLYKERLV